MLSSIIPDGQEDEANAVQMQCKCSANAVKCNRSESGSRWNIWWVSAGQKDTCALLPSYKFSRNTGKEGRLIIKWDIQWDIKWNIKGVGGLGGRPSQ